MQNKVVRILKEQIQFGEQAAVRFSSFVVSLTYTLSFSWHRCFSK
jgi:hypothetical protein